MDLSESFAFSMNAVLPLVLLALLGYFLRRKGFFTEEFAKVGNKFIFQICLSSLLFINIYNISEFDVSYIKVMQFTVCSVLVLIAIAILYAAFFVKDPKQKGVIAQAFFRSNFAMIGIPLAQTLFGEQGGAVGAVILSCAVPLFNIFSVIVLTVFIKDSDHKFSLKSMILKILTNPLIDGILAGLVCQLIHPYLGGWTLKSGNLAFLYKTIENLSKLASPLALVILGAQFKFSAVKRLFSKIAFCVVVRLIVVPIAALSAAHYFFPEFSGAENAGFLALFGTPSAVAGAIMATQMGNDSELASQILVWTTFFSGFTLFLFIAFFRMVGIF